MRSLFRSLDACRVRYLLISGQASVVYGAAHFSQDVDLWVDPVSSNVRALLRALADLGARVHKLTPPLSQKHLRRGHGFHFVVPQRGELDLYLDVMGQPPRVGRFGPARRRARRMRTPWGTLGVVSIEDLVRIKATNRPSDYEVITRLAIIRLAEEKRPRAAILRWAISNIFQAEDLWKVIEALSLRPAQVRGARSAVFLSRIRQRERRPSARDLARVAGWLAERAKRLQDRGRVYWMPRIDELRSMRKRGELLPEKTPVSSLLVRR